MGIVTSQSEYPDLVVSLFELLMCLHMLIHFLLKVLCLYLRKIFTYLKKSSLCCRNYATENDYEAIIGTEAALPYFKIMCYHFPV